MRLLRIIFAVVIVALTSYGLITDTIGVILPFALLLIGLLFIATGFVEFQKRKPVAFTTFLAAGFSLFVGIYTF
ncbi:hypothetical protein [Oceanobacillus iheyensis HTE831]|uniref:DUF3953 domain-containing protein n=1 Tax=Oceanobacillus iheyensis (strain DSM 14371 / CIP 107618 / JCM 11309 / KCTC 3954 / HTE831) TaxID=221109 RepID=Q8ESH9_OCEIH|nr:DUF3953 domain-containing protein [Oceanobacillus iheyensis]BAC12613.1 hypothetical protein [Oceanobacillus iheyensis HTE831]